MTWTLDKSKAEYAEISNSEQAKFDEWQNAVNNDGTHPKTAAENARCDDYKNLSGNEFQIRLGGKNRVVFEVDDENEVVTVLQVGGHT